MPFSKMGAHLELVKVLQKAHVLLYQVKGLIWFSIILQIKSSQNSNCRSFVYR